MKEEQSLKQAVLEKIQTLATAGFGLVAALAWNDAIKGLFEVLFKKPENSLIAQFAYAIVVTVVVVFITVSLAKYIEKQD